MRMPLGVAVAMLGLVLTPLNSPAAENVLERVPADAWGFAVVPGLAQLDAKIERLQQALGVPIPKAFPLLEQAGGMGQGLDAQGTALAIVMPGSDAQGSPSVVALVPTTNYEQLAKSLEAKDPAAKVTEVQVASRGMLLGKVDRYAALADAKDRAALERVLQPAGNLSSELKSYEAWLAENDVTVVVTRKGIEALTERGRKFLKQIETAIDSQPLPKEQKEQIVAGFQVHRLMLQAVDREIAMLGLGARLKENDSLVFVGRTRLMPQGRLAQLDLRKEAGKDRLLAQFPSVPFVVAGDGVMNEKTMDLLMDLATEMPQNQGYGLTPEQMRQVYDASRDLMKKVHRMAMMLAVGEKDSPIYANTVALMTVDDAPQFLRDYPSLIQKTKEILGDVKDSPFGPLETSSLEIAGRPGLKVVMGRPKAPAGPAVPMFDQMMDAMLGPGNPIVAYLAAADEHTVVAGYVNPDLIERTIKGLGGTDGLAQRPEVKTTAALLPKDATFVGYWSVPGTFQLVNRVVAVVSQGKMSALQLPEFPETPPVGIAKTLGDEELRCQVVLPKETVQGVGQYLAKLHLPKQQAEKPE